MERGKTTKKKRERRYSSAPMCWSEKKVNVPLALREKKKKGHQPSAGGTQQKREPHHPPPKKKNAGRVEEKRGILSRRSSLEKKLIMIKIDILPSGAIASVKKEAPGQTPSTRPAKEKEKETTTVCRLLKKKEKAVEPELHYLAGRKIKSKRHKPGS